MAIIIRNKTPLFSHICILIILSMLLISCKINRPPANHLRITVIENGVEVTKDIERTKLDSLDQNQLKQVNQFLSIIQSSYPESNEFIYIKYYPGKDMCNSTGSMTRNKFGDRDLYFRSEVQKRENVTATWVYKDIDGLERYSKETNYHSDSDNIIENTFFTYHYPCSSYVILHKSGKYFAFFGESYYLQHIKDIDHFMVLIQNQKIS